MKSFRWLVGITFAFMIGLATVHWVETRNTAASSPCVQNLHVIQACKENWMSKNQKTTNDTPTWEELKLGLTGYSNRYGWSNGVPICPDGGTYAVGRVGEAPRCSIGGPMHSLSMK